VKDVLFAGVALALALVVPARAAPLVVAELYTSQGCSSCPPADALLGELKRSQANLLPLAFHVDYWDRLGWKDPYSLAGATLAQRRADAALGSDIYTPQLVVNGRRAVVGSDRAAVFASLAAAANDAASATLALSWQGGAVAIELGGSFVSGGILWLIGFDEQHMTPVGRGENAGRQLTEVNIVRDIRTLDEWDGMARHLRVARPSGERAAVLLRAADGTILAAGLLPGQKSAEE
jgi:hypothetical protein